MIIESGMKLKGRLSWEVINKDGSIDKSSGGLYDNLILNSGLDLIGPSGAVTGGGTHEGGGKVIADTFLYCAVGTSNAAPNVSQSGFMTTEVTRTNAYNTSSGMCGTEVKKHFEGNYIKLYRTFDFPKGTFDNESLAEVGFSPYNTKADNLWSRALFKVGGTPTTVSVSSTQILRIRYELTIQFDTDWNTGKSVNINGTSYGYKDAYVVHGCFIYHDNYLTALLPISNVNSNGSTYNMYIADPSALNDWFNVSVTNDASKLENNLFISAVNIRDDSNYSNYGQKGILKYSSGNYFIDTKITFDTSNGNIPIKAIFTSNISPYNARYFVGGYAIIFDTPFTKDSLHEMIITLRMSWGRA